MLAPLQVISETISRRVCPLYALHPQKGTLELVGTGIPLALPGVSCLITAAHIFDGTGNQLLRTMGTRSMIQLNGRTVAFTLGNLNEADLDLAAISLSTDLVADLKGRFTFTTAADLGNFRGVSRHTRFVVAGYPASANAVKAAKRPTVRARPVSYICAQLAQLADIGASTKGPLTHFSVAVPHATLCNFRGEKVDFTKPTGMSGGGIWRLQIDSTTEFAEEPALVGIGIEYVAKHQVFIGTRVGYAVQLANLLRE